MTKSSKIGFNWGNVALHLADKYDRLAAVIKEQVQNALDANATKVWVNIDMKKRTVVVRDNGDGVSEEDFNEALSSIADSVKEKGKLGRFGIGLISPLGKCIQFVFTSRSRKSDKRFRTWTFVTEDVKSQQDEISIPMQVRMDMQGRAVANMSWSTEVRMTGVTTDRYVSKIDLDTLEADIQSTFGVVMRKVKAVVELSYTDGNGHTYVTREIRARSYTGKKLPVYYVDNVDAGRVTFALYVVDKTAKGHNGKVEFGESDDDFRLSARQLYAFSRDILPSEIRNVFISGLFGGEILGEKIELATSRKSFVKNDAFIGFCLAIEEWYKRVGSEFVEQAKEQEREQRWQDSGRRTIDLLETMLKDPRHEALRELFQSFRFGTQGSGHFETPDLLKGEQPHKSITSNGNGSGKEGSVATGTPKKERSDHIPITAAGPSGQHRKIVRGNSKGLSLTYYQETGAQLWTLDTTQGILNFNTRHGIWLMCEPKDKWLDRLQQFVIVQVLTLYSMPDNLAEERRDTFDELTENYASLIVFGEQKA